MQESINTPAAPDLAYPAANQPHDRQYMAGNLLLTARRKLWNLEYLLANSLCILWSATRSWAGHIRSQSATKRNEVGVGSAFVKAPRGGYQANTRTIHRASCIENLSAKHPWVDTVDLRMFLAGFDAGEEWSWRTMYNETGTPMHTSGRH
jgi:hypothetical protein